MTITNVTTDDAAEIAEIYNHYIKDTTTTFETEPLSVEQMRRRIDDISSEFPYFVARDDAGRMIGYCCVHRWKERRSYFPTVECTVYLRDGESHQGVGTLLMKHLIEECRNMGIHSIIACITAENRVSVEFHRKLGFEQVSMFKEVGCKFGRFLDVIDMQLML